MLTQWGPGAAHLVADVFGKCCLEYIMTTYNIAVHVQLQAQCSYSESLPVEEVCK